MPHLFRSVLAGVIIGLIIHACRGQPLISLLGGALAAVSVMGVLRFAKDASDLAKNVQDLRKTDLDIKLKRKELDKTESRIHSPTLDDIRNCALPFEVQEKSLKGFLKRPESELIPRVIVTAASERKIKPKGEGG